MRRWEGVIRVWPIRSRRKETSGNKKLKILRNKKIKNQKKTKIEKCSYFAFLCDIFDAMFLIFDLKFLIKNS